MVNLNNVTVSTITDYDNGVLCEWLGSDLGELDGPCIPDSYTVTSTTANYGSPTRCGKIIRRFNHRSNEPPERYLKCIYRLLSEECALANKQVRFLNGGQLVPTRNGQSIAYEFEVGTWGNDFKAEYTLSVPVLRR